MTEYKSLESQIRELARASMQKKFDEAQLRFTTKKVVEEPTKPEPEVIKEEETAAVEQEVEPIEELAPAIDPMKAKMDAQRMQVQKQRDQFKMQLQKQKAAKQMQSDKAKGEKELEKIKEDELLDERQVMRVRTFGRASKLQQLHNRQYSRLMASGNLAKAEMHRKRSIEYKRVMYQAKDNPDRLPSI